jgi:two-component system, NtrC family, response regulator HydG
MSDLRILVVDDDLDTARAVAEELSDLPSQCEIAVSGAAALAVCRHLEFDAMVTDVRMDGIDGLDLITRVQRMQPGLPVVVLTGDASIAAAVDAVKRGAHQFLEKPCEGDVLRDAVSAAIAARTRPSVRLDPAVPVSTEKLLGQSKAMSELRARIELIGRADSAVLIQGETGTGKELVARAIHACSARRSGPFVSVNASAIPEALLESELFGHVRGAFTGATHAHRGLFAEAHTGVLLLDEIGDMPLPLQAKLLRVLQSGEVRPVGGDRPTQVDVRVIAATHRRLASLAKEGKFRSDLFYRLNVVHISVPPLRERPDDIPELASAFLELARSRAPESPARAIAPDLLDVLVQASWIGNVRELESAIERLVVFAQREVLTAADLAMQIDETPPSQREPSDPNLEALIQRHVGRILEDCAGNKALAAKLLGIDLSTLYRWQRKWSE